MQRKEANIGKDTTLSIIAASSEIDLEQPLFAINWFDTKRKWLYNLYVLLASPYAQKVGARMIFKGQQIEKITGNDSDGRELLLIVRYPTAGNFLQLMSFKMFLLISLLRIKAVKHFTFGFMQKITPDNPAGKAGKGNPALFHHFKGLPIPLHQVEQLKEEAAKNHIQLIFAGTKAASLQRRQKGKTQEIPFLMEGLLLFQGNDQTSLRHFFEHPTYRHFREQQQDHYAALLEKLF